MRSRLPNEGGGIATCSSCCAASRLRWPTLSPSLRATSSVALSGLRFSACPSRSAPPSPSATAWTWTSAPWQRRCSGRWERSRRVCTGHGAGFVDGSQPTPTCIADRLRRGGLTMTTVGEALELELRATLESYLTASVGDSDIRPMVRSRLATSSRPQRRIPHRWALTAVVAALAVTGGTVYGLSTLITRPVVVHHTPPPTTS